MPLSTLRATIQTALKNAAGPDFAAAATELLHALGYRSDRRLREQTGAVDDFLRAFPAERPGTDSERALCENAASVRLLFQVTSDEIAASQPPRLDSGLAAFEQGRQRSFLFFAVALKQASYPRSRYAAFTREINKRFPAPVVVLFRSSDDRLSLAFVHRRRNTLDQSRDVLGRVSLIREINPTAPHRAHLDILAGLSLENLLDWMTSHHTPHNFDGLLNAQLDTLDTRELNRRFYRQLFDWFSRGVTEARFPKGRSGDTSPARTLSPEEHIIRLITRLLFVWFIKEKGLVADELFNESSVAALLRDYDRDTGDSWYRAVLQNLFFATLNTERTKRGFSSGKRTTHRNFSLYRYRSELRDPDALLALFSRTPFINGGLFDCLDSEEATSEQGWRIDCFTDNPRHRRDYSIPNRLFFDDHGLIPLFNSYKFTVEENTPIEQEVALDPELLGKVFENLLAAYNPETRDTARKQTGSYYTPRPVVDYMVDEALVAALAERCQPSDNDCVFWQERLRYLLDYADAFSDASALFDAAETDAVVRAIAGLRVLDPAVGSGAFPMGVLHKLTLALRRLDPDNTRWEGLQKAIARDRAQAAFDTRDQGDREAELTEISQTFERYRDSDFGRKLYLIQNSIFGVDIQPVACQIAKLRFFISLAIEQEPDPAADNFGLKPLPNLETRFIAADTLLGLKGERMLTSAKAQQVEHQLLDNRERHFHATTRRKKLEYKRKDKQLRKSLAQALQSLGFPADDADKIAGWDPYDQNARADWFDAEYMFGVAEGFDVVIGNPPYVQLQKNAGELGKLYKDAGFATFARSGDIYQLFYERGGQLLTPQHGLLSYITSNSWLKAEYGKPLRRWFSEQHTPLRLLEMGKDVFENAIVDTSVLIARQGKSGEAGRAVDMDRLPDKDFPPAESLWGVLRPQGEKPWGALSALEQSVMDKMEAKGTLLKDWDVKINYGIKTGYNTAFHIDDATRQALIDEDPASADIIKPVLRGRDIRRYRAEWAGLWLITTFPSLELDIDAYPAVKKHLLSFGKERLEQSGKKLADGAKARKKTGNKWFEMQDQIAYHTDFTKEKLVWIELVEAGRFAYDDSGIYCEATGFIMTGERIKFLCAVLNAKLARWFLLKSAPTSGMGTLRWKKVYVEPIPIPKISPAKQRPFIRLLDRILKAKAADPSADTAEQEAEIDRLVYGLYGLTEEEVRAVEGRRA